MLADIDDGLISTVVVKDMSRFGSDFEELTPEILRAFIDKVLIYEKQKVDGHYKHTIEIIYNFVGAVEIPDFD